MLVYMEGLKSRHKAYWLAVVNDSVLVHCLKKILQYVFLLAMPGYKLHMLFSQLILFLYLS